MKLEQGQKYTATLSLGMFEAMVGNDRIAGEFRKVGFTDVTVTGSGSTRTAIGTWPQASREVAFPSQVVKSSVRKLP